MPSYVSEQTLFLLITATMSVFMKAAILRAITALMIVENLNDIVGLE
jgi:hypothetical protein